MAMDADRRASLFSAKLAALVKNNFGAVGRAGDAASDALGHAVSPSHAIGLGVGAALFHSSTAWVLVEEKPERGLGVALTWALRHEATHLHVLVSDGAGQLARRAGEFAADISVWSIEGGSTSNELVMATSEPLADEPCVDQRHVSFVDLMLDCGVDVVIEHGVVCGEVFGLEVCRVVTDEITGECRLEVGVGAHDREAFGLMHGDIPTPDSLRRIADVVARHRRPGADPHPLNRLGAERALRSRLMQEPGLVDAQYLRWAAPAAPRPNLKDPMPCVAVGDGRDGQPVVVVCSTGIDIDVVPFAADARLFHGNPDTELVIAVPERDATKLTRQMAGALRHPARVIGLPSA